MTGLIVALPPASNFPAGSLTYAFYAAAVLKAPIYAPGGIASEFCPEHIRVNSFPYISNTTKYDFSLITPVSNELMEYIDRLPRPIIVVVHDGHTLYEFGGKDWVSKVDGFLVDVDPTISCILKMANNASVLRIQLPYVRRPFGQYNEFPIWEDKKNIIVSLGRIVPDRGHRLVATLCSMGYNVLVVGQEVRHDEYGLYYKKILDAGANIIPTPSDSEKFDILGSAKIAMGFSFTQEVDEPVEYCFPAGTNVVVQNGDYGPNGNPNVSTRQYNGCGWYKIKKIENMSYGDKVLSYDSKSWKKCSDDVEKISVRKTDSIVYLKFSNGNEIRTTSNHPFAVMNGKGKFNWIHVSELKVGDKVIQYKYDGFARDINNILKKGKTPQHLINNDVRRKAEVTKKNNIEYQNKLKDNASKLGCISGPINQKYCNTIEARKKKSLSQKNNFKDPEFCKRWGKLHHVKPSGLEVRYMSMLDEWFPELWEYVGNFELMIDGKNPDFRLKDSNKIIELNGTYWHQGENDEEVMSFYKNNGWDCLVIWDHEIDDRAKVENFMHNPNVEIIEVSYISNDWRSEEIGNIKSKFELIYKNGLFSVWNRGNVYTVEKGFENVGKLRTKCFDDVIKFIDNIKDKTIDVYNLEVKNNHNFYANGILVHNSNLECMNMGCYPIVANWQKRYFDDAGFSFNSIESPAAAPQYIDRMFSDNEYYIGCCKYNISVLDNYSRQFGVRFEKFVSELKNRVNCSNCGAIIPVRSMYCAICGKK